MQHPARGAGVCWFHGAGRANVRETGRRRLALAEATKLMQTYGRPIVTDPAQALLDEIARTAGHVAWLGARVAALQPEQLVDGVAQTTTVEPAAAEDADSRPSRVEVVRRVGVNVFVQLYMAERKHLAQVAEAALKCGIEDRRVRLAESQGAVIVNLLRRVLDAEELGLTADQKRLGRQLAAGQLRALSGGPEA